MPFVYVGADRAAPQGEAILVAKDSPIRTRRRSEGQACRLQSRLERALSPDRGAGKSRAQVQRHRAELSGARRRPRGVRARQRRCVGDLGPVSSLRGQAATQARVLVDATGAGAQSGNSIWLTRRVREIVAAIWSARSSWSETGKTDSWAEKHQDDVAKLVLAHAGLACRSTCFSVALARLGYGVGPITPATSSPASSASPIPFFKAGVLPQEDLECARGRMRVWHEPARRR